MPGAEAAGAGVRREPVRAVTGSRTFARELLTRSRPAWRTIATMSEFPHRESPLDRVAIDRMVNNDTAYLKLRNNGLVARSARYWLYILLQISG